MTDLKTVRINAGITQSKMSEMFNIPLRTIESWESGKRRPTEWAERLIINELLKMSKGKPDQ